MDNRGTLANSIGANFNFLVQSRGFHIGPEDFHHSFERESPDAYPVCVLCRFEFETGDRIVTFVPDPYKSTPYQISIYATPSHDFVSSNFQNGCHHACARLADKTGLYKDDTMDPDIFDATSYGYVMLDPLPSFMARRVRWLRKTYALNLANDLGNRLPLEMFENIASHCLQNRAVQVLADLWLQPDRTGPRAMRFSVCKTGSVWAQYIQIEGMRYIRSLSSGYQSEKDVEIFAPDPESDDPLNVYVVEDHLGVRDVMITYGDDRPVVDPEAEPWLRTIVYRHQPMPFLFRVRFDGLKLRRLAITKTKDAEPDFRQRRWAVLPKLYDSFPQPPPVSNDFIEMHKDHPVFAFDWNAPRVCGYSFLLDQDAFYRIVAHKSGESPSKRRDEFEKFDESWLYMPIDPGERITELWLREEVGHHESFGTWKGKTLIIRTNKNRSLVLGTNQGSNWPASYNVESTYKAIAALPETPLRMFYAKVNRAKGWLGFEQAPTWDHREVKIRQPCLRMLSVFADGYKYTSINLDHVKFVTPCRAWKKMLNNAIVGLLFTYADGRQRCAGQVRPDCLEAPIEISTDTMWMGCTRSTCYDWHETAWPPSGESASIDWLGFSKPLPQRERAYLEIPLRGRLDWCFSTYNCAVSYSECNKEMHDEMRQVLAHEAESGKACPDQIVKTFAEQIACSLTLVKRSSEHGYLGSFENQYTASSIHPKTTTLSSPIPAPAEPYRSRGPKLDAPIPPPTSATWARHPWSFTSTPPLSFYLEPNASLHCWGWESRPAAQDINHNSSHSCHLTPSPISPSDSLTPSSLTMLSSLTTKLALKKAGIPSDILDFSSAPKREPNKLRKNPPQPSENDADAGWGSWMSIRSLPLTVQPWLTPPPAAGAVGRVPGIGDKAPIDKTHKLRLGGGKRVLLVFLRCVGCASVSHASEQATQKWVSLLGGAWSVRVIVDQERALYAAWGLGTGSMWYVFNPTTQVQGWKETGWLGEKVAGAIQGKGTAEKKPAVKTNVEEVDEEDEGPLTTMGNKWQEAGAFAIDGTGTVIWGGKAARADDVMELEDGARILLA
ncbi:hypothetical protein F66182_5283 [Fusarium sp. NRRL 66182]|nr:hypothetical protein F66182_5283 [Fusarium sp. NRRL 66182]